MRRRKFKVEHIPVAKEILVSDETLCDHCGDDISGPHFRVLTGYDYFKSKVKQPLVHERDYCSRRCLEAAMKDYIDNLNSDKSEGAYFNVTYVLKPEKEEGEKNG